jgi:hypothetical protein
MVEFASFCLLFVCIFVFFLSLQLFLVSRRELLCARSPGPLKKTPKGLRVPSVLHTSRTILTTTAVSFLPHCIFLRSAFSLRNKFKVTHDDYSET